jgi:hypothetical protein
MWTWLTGILSNKALLWSIAKYAAVLFVGYVIGGWLGGFGDYKRGYRAGYQDGKAGEREKLFPNLFSGPDPPHVRPIETCPNQNGKRGCLSPLDVIASNS